MANFRTFSRNLHWGVKRPLKYGNFHISHRTSFDPYTISNNMLYQKTLIGHRKYGFKNVIVVRVFVWTLPFSAKMPQNASLKHFLRNNPQAFMDV
jgi:hypothetical protein